MVDLSIIILNYNTRDYLRDCLSSVKKMEERAKARSFGIGRWKMEMIVIDNGSTDGSQEMVEREFPEVNFIKNKQNLGFARGNNLGIKKSQGRYVLLLNSDTVMDKETIPQMITFMEKNPAVGVATCRVEFPDGRLDPACHRGFPTPWASLTYFLGLERLFPKSHFFGQYHLGFLPMDRPHEIDSPTGAFYLIKREVIKTVGLLDEDYFMYGEDLDWSYRIKQAVWKIMYNPEVKITHFKKQSGRAKEDGKVRKETTRYFYETMKTFYKKHYSKKYLWIETSLIMLAIEIKKQFSILKS